MTLKLRRLRKRPVEHAPRPAARHRRGERQPPRRRVPVVTLANSELDLVLRPWRARRRKCATALSHFVDLVATLAAKFYPERNGSDAVDAMLETMELAAAGASLA